MEAAGEAVRLVSLSDQAQLAWLFGVLGAHVLDVDLWGGGGVTQAAHSHRSGELEPLTHLTGFQAQFDLHLAGLSAHPHVHLEGNHRRRNKTAENRQSTFHQDD